MSGILALIDADGAPQAIRLDKGCLPVALMVWDAEAGAWKRWSGGGGASGGGLTDDELRAAPVEILGAVAGPLTDDELRANAVPVSLASVPSHGVTGPLTDEQLRAAAVPVSLAAGNAFTFVSAKTAAPTASSVQCDTGQLAAGDYELDIHLVASDTVAVGKGLVIEHRNAANNANINVLGGCTAAETIDISIARITLAQNERIRVIAGTAAGAASSMYVSSIGRRLVS